MTPHPPPAPPIDLAAAPMPGLLAGLWGGADVFVGIAVREVTPLTRVPCRLVPGAAALHPVRLLRRVAIPPSLWRRVAVMALLNTAIPFVLIFWAQTRIAAGLAAIGGRLLRRP